MMKYEVKKLFKIKGKHYNDYMPCGLNIIEKLWWWLVPGVIVKVKWPVGEVVVEYGDPGWYDVGASRVSTFSADPNDHYRPWMEKNIGRQGWDWNWGFVGNDVSENNLTIKVRQKYQNLAVYMALKWQ